MSALLIAGHPHCPGAAGQPFTSSLHSWLQVTRIALNTRDCRSRALPWSCWTSWGTWAAGGHPSFTGGSEQQAQGPPLPRVRQRQPGRARLDCWCSASVSNSCHAKTAVLHHFQLVFTTARSDVKPENIVVEGGRTGGRVFLVDFGGVQVGTC